MYYNYPKLNKRLFTKTGNRDNCMYHLQITYSMLSIENLSDTFLYVVINEFAAQRELSYVHRYVSRKQLTKTKL
jgi:hypothetical protein